MGLVEETEQLSQETGEKLSIVSENSIKCCENKRNTHSRFMAKLILHESMVLLKVGYLKCTDNIYCYRTLSISSPKINGPYHTFRCNYSMPVGHHVVLYHASHHVQNNISPGGHAL